MRVLIACEESQAVTKEFRRLGHEAYSCDIRPCSGGHPEWHIQDDVLKHLLGKSDDLGDMGSIAVRVNKRWDMIIAFPPCTDLAVSGARYFEQKRKDGRQDAAINFFLMISIAPCDKIAIENPVGIMSSVWRKPDQIIQPYQFGHPESKKTCLWLKNLPLLEPTNVLPLPESGRWENQTPSGQNKLGPSPERARLGSKTYQGIAKAMAEQWSNCEMEIQQELLVGGE
jgi:site-specific DNA-cytosine methylase